MTCQFCMFFDRDIDDQDNFRSIGLCRRKPPGSAVKWPTVNVHDWCGEMRLTQYHVQEIYSTARIDADVRREKRKTAP